MDFGLTEDQQDLLAGVRLFAERELAPTAFDFDDRHRFQDERIKKPATDRVRWG